MAGAFLLGEPMQPKEIRAEIIKPTLQSAQLWSQSAEILVYGTGYVESKYIYEEQIGQPINGGIGYWQDEPSDYEDLCNWLNYYQNELLLDRVLSAAGCDKLPSDIKALESNIKLALLICRLHYYRVKAALPDASDAHGMAQYHKTWYNSALGAANVDKNAIVFQQIIDGQL